MPSENQDEKLRKLFHQLREVDQATMPSFSSIWQNLLATHQQTPRYRPSWIAVGSVITVLLVVVSIQLFHSPIPPELVLPSKLTLSDWQSSTTFLLAYPGHELLIEVPKFEGRPL